MKIGSLFSGVGGLDLGLEWAGVGETVWQVEKDPFCRAVLAKHWPHATRYDDVCTVGSHNLEPVDVICGGFPCQDISYAGKGAGLAGARSGLWYEFARIIGEMGPQYVVVENVAALINRGLDAVLGTLSDFGYDAEWSIVSACSVGAPHVRRRLFVVAYANGEHGRPRVRNTPTQPQRALSAIDRFAHTRAGWQARLANPSALYGGADGIRDGSHRNRALGNSVSPQVAEVVGQRLLEIDAELQLTESTNAA